jgi:glycerophosphoryl diester phosphodiesterase
MELIAHRGFTTTNRAQNTLYALKKSIQQGADSVEFDINRSSDGIYYLFHDNDVDALTFGTGAIESLTSAYIDTLLFRSTAGSKLQDIRVTRLTAALDYIKKERIHCYIEVKQDTPEKCIEVIDIITAYGVLDLVTIQASTIASQIAMIEYSNNVKVGGLSTTSNLSFVIAHLNNFADYVDRFALFSSYTAIFDNNAIITEARSRGFDVVTWTVNTKDEIDILMSLGVRRIMSDINFKGW